MQWLRKRSVGLRIDSIRRFPVGMASTPEYHRLPPEAFGSSWKSTRAAAPDSSVGTPRVKVFILSHVADRLDSVPDWPEFERVLLPALPLERDLRTNLIGEGRAFLADLDVEQAEYVGYMNARAPAKYRGALEDPAEYWESFRARLASLTPGVVLAPSIAESWWAEFSDQVHPGMLRLLHEVRDLTGLRLDTGRISLWANDMVMHRSVWAEWLVFWRGCFTHFHRLWGWDWPFPPIGLDASRKPAYFAERWTTLFFANRADLQIVRI